MLEEKALRTGENHAQLWFLLAGYGMFRSIHEPERIDFHLQATIDRLSLLLYKALGREEQLRQLKTVAGLGVPPVMSNHDLDKVMSLCFNDTSSIKAKSFRKLPRSC